MFVLFSIFLNIFVIGKAQGALRGPKVPSWGPRYPNGSPQSSPRCPHGFQGSVSRHPLAPQRGPRAAQREAKVELREAKNAHKGNQRDKEYIHVGGL